MSEDSARLVSRHRRHVLRLDREGRGSREDVPGYWRTERNRRNELPAPLELRAVDSGARREHRPGRGGMLAVSNERRSRRELGLTNEALVVVALASIGGGGQIVRRRGARP